MRELTPSGRVARSPMLVLGWPVGQYGRPLDLRELLLERAERGVAWSIMRNTLHTYTAYTIGCGIVWAVILLVVGTQASHDTRRTIFLVFGGWVIGWTSATIARSVYPPPGRKSK